MTDRIWISWEHQRRNRTLSPYVNAKLYELNINSPWWIRYPVAVTRTLGIFVKERPHTIFAQNPSIVLAILATVYARLTNKTIILDAHNAGLFPVEGKSRLLNWLAARITKLATLTIVSNTELVKLVDSLGGRSFAIPDPIPVIEPVDNDDSSGNTFTVLFICSWSEDEPYREVLKSGECLEPDVRICITGNSKGLAATENATLSKNIELTGYVSDDAFSGLLYSADAVMVLTTRSNCLLCGAYEGVSAGKPLILSDTPVLREYFDKGSIYVENSADSICLGIKMLRAEYEKYVREVGSLKAERNLEFNRTISDFNKLLEVL
jgi:glycosyltransferase involved in cell wall biosynthesis